MWWGGVVAGGFGGMHGEGGGLGVCMAGGCAWPEGVCGRGVMHGREGGVHGGGHA